MSSITLPDIRPTTSKNTKTLNLRLNRVEGDLEIRVEIDNNTVTDAWSAGTMYRGFENILRNRAALDSLVITPRICGICSTAHLLAAAKALDAISGVDVPANAIRVRNIALMAELLQSDIRQTFLMFTPDLINDIYSDKPGYEQAFSKYQPFKGSMAIEAVKYTKSILEIVAIIGGQWPHSSYMIPGGLASIVSNDGLMQCEHILARFRHWYESRILGCSIERWREIGTRSDLDNWLSESLAHRNSEVGFFLTYCRNLGLDKIGGGHDRFISYGAFELPPDTKVQSQGECATHLFSPGVAYGTNTESLNQQNITEHIAYSWFTGYEGGKHPFDGMTNPYASGEEKSKYTWAKAPRYRNQPAETGPLAEMLVSQNGLFTDLVTSEGANVLSRQLARLVRPAQLIPAMETWLTETTTDEAFYRKPPKITDGEGFGLTEASRGGLGHWVKISDGVIDHYQIITPTAWNGSPRDSEGVRGPWEEALVGTLIQDKNNAIELEHIVRSFDPCLVCTVHTMERGKAGKTL